MDLLRRDHQQPRSIAAPAGSGAGLHICPECASELVHPLECAPVDMCNWRLELRCPECGDERVGVFSQEVLDRFEQVLDAGTRTLIDDLQSLQRDNMEQQLASLNVALASDLLLPEDF